MLKLYNLIQYSGIGAGVFLVAAAVTGIMRADVEIHEKLGLTALALGLLHGGMVMYRNIKMRSAKKQAVK
jgi:hypothetical protein